MALFGSSGPKIAPDTLRSNAVLDLLELISEGPIQGLVTNDDKSVYLDNVPVENDDGSYNFQGYTSEFRQGTRDQLPMSTLTYVEEENDVNLKVYHAVPLVQEVSNPDYTDCRLVFNIPALQAENVKSGNVYADTISFQIEVQYLGGDWQDSGFGIINVYGKCTSNYQLMKQFTLPQNPSGDSSPWLLRVTKITGDSTDTYNNPDIEVVLTNDLYLQSVVGLVNRQFTYPRSCMMHLSLNAQSFGTSLPVRSYEVYGLILQVPSNYDPVARTYSGLWDGTFKSAYSNNPAWVFYDMLVNNVYGLGQYISVSQVDKYALYQIGVYCDEQVPDGYGGTEPRFTFNMQIKDAKEAYQALSTIASAFRCMPYWSSGAVTLSQDSPADPVLLVTPANVVEGSFSYTSTALKARHTTATVRWTNPDLNYQDDYETVDDNYAINRYGYRELQIDAVGCTSRGQARRMGLWAISNELTNTQSVTYRAGYDHAVIMPGDIVEIQDPTLANADFGGRLEAGSTSTRLFLDRVVQVPPGTFVSVSVVLPDGSIGTSQVSGARAGMNVDTGAQGADSGVTVDVQSSESYDTADSSVFVTTSLDTTVDSGEAVNNPDRLDLYSVLDLATALPLSPTPGAIWVLYTSTSTSCLFRVIGKNEVARGTYEINALQHNPDIYGYIDAQFLFDPSTVVGGGATIHSPTNLTFSEQFYYANGGYQQSLSISWATVTSGKPAAGYILQVNGPLNSLTTNQIGANSYTLYNAAPGEFDVQVQAVDATGNKSAPLTGSFTVTGWASVPTPSVTNLSLAGGGSNVFSTPTASISWTNDLNGSPSYPVTNVVRVYDRDSGNLLRTVTTSNPHYDYTLDLNTADGGPFRNLRFSVTGKAPSGAEGTAAVLDASNPAPVAVAPLVQAASGQVLVSYGVNESDIRGARVWVSSDSGFTPDPSNVTYDGANNPVGIPVSPGSYRVWVALYDVMGEVKLNLSSPVPITL